MKRRGSLVKYLTALFVIVTSCTPKAVDVSVSSVSLNATSLEMMPGDTFNLVATVLPRRVQPYEFVHWESSNHEVADVEGAYAKTTLRAHKPGDATISTNIGGKTASCDVTVSWGDYWKNYIYIESISFDKKSIFLRVGDSAALTVIIKPDNATNKSLSWYYDSEYLKVEDGKVTALKGLPRSYGFFGHRTIKITAGAIRWDIPDAKSDFVVAECDVYITEE
jgi:uncharacterized protein YjdB